MLLLYLAKLNACDIIILQYQKVQNGPSARKQLGLIQCNCLRHQQQQKCCYWHKAEVSRYMW